MYKTLGINDTKSLAPSSSMSLRSVVAPNYLTFRQKTKTKILVWTAKIGLGRIFVRSKNSQNIKNAIVKKPVFLD